MTTAPVRLLPASQTEVEEVCASLKLLNISAERLENNEILVSKRDMVVEVKAPFTPSRRTMIADSAMQKESYDCVITLLKETHPELIINWDGESDFQLHLCVKRQIT